jgi:hypothetical protein
MAGDHVRTFVDNAGRTWTLAINVWAVKKVKGLLGVDLYSLIDGNFEALGKLVGDPVGLVEVLYCLCKDEADRLGVSDEDFGRGMGGDSLARATDAFLAEYTDFFPDPRVRAGLAKVLEKGKIVRDLMMDRMEEMLDKVDPGSEAAKLIGSSGNLRVASGSTRGRSRSAS